MTSLTSFRTVRRKSTNATDAAPNHGKLTRYRCSRDGPRRLVSARCKAFTVHYGVAITVVQSHNTQHGVTRTSEDTKYRLSHKISPNAQENTLHLCNQNSILTLTTSPKLASGFSSFTRGRLPCEYRKKAERARLGLLGSCGGVNKQLSIKTLYSF